MFIYAVLLGVGVVFGWSAKDYLLNHDAMDLKSKNVTLGRDKLLNPLLACEVAETTLRTKQLRPFKHKVKTLIAERIKAGMADEISVYFRDLDDGGVFSIDGNRGFTPASLGKLPIMIAYLKLAEDDPTLLNKRIKYDGKKDLASKQYFKPRKNLEPGKTYTIDDLIFRMIAYSDNNSWGLLLANIDLGYLNSVVAELGASFIEGPSGETLITVKSYSIFLRILYNASYLNKKMSEKALEYLAMEEFPLGIVASVPKGITVASKFAERQYGVNGEIRILHNYGIVYHPKQPYLICIMTKGRDYDQLATVIHDISKTVYDEVEIQTRGQ
jgi:beta-lactamase class A